MSQTAEFFLAFALVLAAAKVFGQLAHRIGQPAVVGEIVVGVLLSPVVLPGAASRVLIPQGIAPLLTALANVGLATFMFMIGHELEGSLLRGRTRSALGLAVGSVVPPFVGGILLAVPLAGAYAPRSHAAFVTFVGVAMSVTAFPVLARILATTGLNRTQLGGLTLAAAAIGDVVAWVGVAAIAVTSGVTGSWRIALLPVYLVLMVGVVRPVVGRVMRAAQARPDLAPGLIPTLGVGLMLSCAATEWLGLHFIFGGFVFGAVLPRSGLDRVRRTVIEGMEHAGSLLLPLYFVIAGTKVTISGFTGARVGVLVSVIAVAIGTKAIGAYWGARVTGVRHGEALVASVLMNTRGLTEIVVVGIALDLGIIDQNFYSMMVIMAVLTTAITGPLLRLVRRHVPRAEARVTAVAGQQEAIRTE
ncbi:MAG TPA: cation:proton antiporter [Pseudonocardiaceae bacterium]